MSIPPVTNGKGFSYNYDNFNEIIVAKLWPTSFQGYVSYSFPISSAVNNGDFLTRIDRYGFWFWRCPYSIPSV